MNFDLLENEEFIKWCYGPLMIPSIINNINKSNKEKFEEHKKYEKEFGNNAIGQEDNGQWTTKLCENGVKEVLTKLGLNPKKVKKGDLISSIKRKNYDKNIEEVRSYNPDFNCDDAYREVKGGNWTIAGTAGEKILGTPIKYGEVPILGDIKKPLKIVLVGYQEYEARHGFACGDILGDGKKTKVLIDYLDFCKKNQIEYIGFTDLLKKIK